MISLFYVKNLNNNLSHTLYIDEIKKRNLDFLKTYDLTFLNEKKLKIVIKNSEMIFFDNSVIASFYEKKWDLENVIFFLKKNEDFYFNMYKILVNSNLPKIYNMCGFDLHWLSNPKINIKEFFKKIDILVWPFENFKTSIKKVDKKYQDYFMIEDNDRTDPIKNWNFLTKNIGKRIEFAHYVSKNELLKKDNRIRFWDLNIPGVSYKTRIIAKGHIERTNIKLYPFSARDQLIRKLHNNLFFLPNFTKNYLFIKSRIIHQRSSFRNSKIAYTCGSGYKYPVRKLFEIPASKTAMILYGNKNYRKLGFIDGRNCIFSDPSDIVKEVRLLLNKKKIRENLVKDCFKMILDNHTLDVRVNNLLICLKMILKNNFNFAKFENGKYIIS